MDQQARSLLFVKYQHSRQCLWRVFICQPIPQSRVYERGQRISAREQGDFYVVQVGSGSYTFEVKREGREARQGPRTASGSNFHGEVRGLGRQKA